LDEYEVVAKDGKWYEKVWDIYKDLMNEFSDRLIRSGESFYGDAERDRCISPVRMYQLESTDIRLLTISKGGPSMKSLPTGIDATSKINDMKKYIEKMNKTNASDKKEKNKDSNKENEKSTR
jgi:uncharacterized spore protein YtfJ